MQETQGPRLDILRAGTSDSVAVADQMGACRGGSRAGIRQHYLYSEVIV